MTFIAGPSTSHNDAVQAERWAQQNNYAFLPTIECVDSLLVGGGGGNWGAPIVTAVIASPSGGQVVNNPVTITGTVQFDSSQADFWHLDIIGGEWTNWTPMGGIQTGSVVGGGLFSGNLPLVLIAFVYALSKVATSSSNPMKSASPFKANSIK